MNKNCSYKISKVLNNNVILSVKLKTEQEVILVGKGLGFGKKNNEVIEVDDHLIQKAFYNFDSTIKKQYLQMLNEQDHELVGLVEEMIAMAEINLGGLDAYIHVVLIDHISFALERLSKQMEINNPFLFEIRTLYKKEFAVALKCKALIVERLKIEIPDDEVGFIALHLHSALQKQDIKTSIKNTRMMKDMLDIIQEALDEKMDTDDILFSSLIRHLQHSIQRTEQGKSVLNPLLQEIKCKFKESFKVGEQIASYIKKHKDITMTQDEVGFLALHIERLKNNQGD